MTQANLVVLISGNGSNLQAIIDACRLGTLKAEVVAVISNRRDAYGLQRAQNAGIPVVILPAKKEQDRTEYDRELARVVTSYQPDWIILAGWMRILSNAFLGQFAKRVVNLHPALPGKFPGTHAIEQAFQAWQAGEISHTGVMVHLVPDEGIDNGPLLNQQVVSIDRNDTVETLEEKIHSVEHKLLVETVQMLISNGIERTILDAKSHSLCL